MSKDEITTEDGVRLVQLLSDNGVEELWYFPLDTTDAEIQLWYQKYNESGEESFEDFIAKEFPKMDAQRIFVDEVYV